MKYLLDTTTCIWAINERAAVLRRIAEQDPDDIAVSVITVAELWFGSRKSAAPARGRAIVDAFLAPLAVLPFESPAAEKYAEARFQLERQGAPIGERDLLVAATALAHQLVVVTNNVGEFERVPGLAVEDWTR